MGAPFEDRKSLEAKLARVHERVGQRIDIRSTSARWAWIEYQLAQGGWSMAQVAVEAWRGGGSFGAWRRALRAHDPEMAPVRKPTSDRLTPGARLDPDLLRARPVDQSA